jgi:hypothetical protein
MKKGDIMQDVPFNDQRTVTDQQFFEHLNLPGECGKQLTAALKSGDLAQARRAVAEHFRTRKTPRWPFYMHGTAWLEIDGRGSALAKADKLLRDEFTNSWPQFQSLNLSTGTPDPDWPRGIKEMQTSIARFSFIPELTTAFSLTGKVEYLKKARDLMYSFVKAYPFVLEEGFHEDHDRYFGGTANPTLTVTYRCFRWMDFIHSGAFQVPGLLSDEDVVWNIKQLWFYSMQFYRFVGDAMRKDNHHLVDHGHMPFAMGCMFPEFSIGDEMLEQGRKTIAHHFSHNIFKDGGYAEHSTKYQYHILYHYLNPQAQAKANGVKLFNQSQLDLLTKWTEFSARACKPNGMLSDFGDEFGGELSYLFGSLAVPVMTPELAAMSRALGFEPGELKTETPASLTRRFSDWQPGQPARVGLSPFYSEDKTVKKPAPNSLPKPASIQYPNGGYTFFRTDWTPQADFLGVAHYTDCNPHCHTHWDMMSFVLHTQGRTLIGDPATWIYTDERRFFGASAQETRGYHYAVDSHNCLVMNDDTLKPLKALGHGCCWGGYPPKHGLGLFKAGGPIELAEIWHDAYAPTRHRRFVVQVNGIGYVFVDLLARPGLDLRPHQYSQRYHFEGGVAIEPTLPESGHNLSVSLGDASCVIVPGRETETFWKSWRDQYLSGVKEVDPANTGGPWVAELTRRMQGPSVFTNFILTHGASAKRSPVARYLGKSPSKAFFQQHEGLSAHAVDLGERGTLLVASCPYGKPLECAELTTDAELAVVVLDAKGAVQHFAMARGSNLKVHGKNLAGNRKRDWQTG